LLVESNFRDPTSNTEEDYKYFSKLTEYFTSSVGPIEEKLFHFSKYVSRQSLTLFLAKYELFKKILNVHGSIIECGVLFGGGLMTFAHLSSIFEPVNYNRKIIGFDTFSGFPKISEHDQGSTSKFVQEGGLAIDSFEDLKKCIEIYDSNRFLNHLPKIELIKGDATVTIPKYIHDNPQTVVSFMYLDFDLYEPTKVALENFVPRMPQGAIIAFDELNYKNFVGETKAVIDTIGIPNLKIQRFSFNTNLSYAILDKKGSDLIDA